MGKKRRSREFKNSSQVIDMEQARKQRLEKRREEREKEEQRAKAEAAQKTRGKMAIRRSRNRRRLTIGLIAVFLAVLMGLSIFNIISLKQEQREVLQQQQQLQHEKEALEEELKAINDPENLEEQARNQLRLIKPGEVLYMFPEEITKNKVIEDPDGEEAGSR